MDFKRLPFRGTLLNTLTVVVGASVGMLAGSALPENMQAVALTGIGLVTIGMGVKLFLETRNVLIPTVAIIGGGLIGAALGIDAWLRSRYPAGGETISQIER